MFIKCKCGNPIHVPPTVGIVCSKCGDRLKITTENTIAFTGGDFKDLGIFWTYYCKHCKHIVDPIPFKKDKFTGKITYEVYCPICKNGDSLIGEFPPDYPKGYEGIADTEDKESAKKFFYYAISLLIYCREKIESPNKDTILLMDNLINTLTNKALNKRGELSLKQVISSWKDISLDYEVLENKLSDLNIISPELRRKYDGPWNDLKNRMSKCKNMDG